MLGGWGTREYTVGSFERQVALVWGLHWKLCRIRLPHAGSSGRSGCTGLCQYPLWQHLRSNLSPVRVVQFVGEDPDGPT